MAIYVVEEGMASAFVQNTAHVIETSVIVQAVATDLGHICIGVEVE